MAETIITRKAAMAQGLKRYYSGKPCPHGHLAERWCASGDCVVCSSRKAADRQIRWAKANPEEARERLRTWRAANPDKRREQTQRHYWSDPEKSRERARQWADDHPEYVGRWAREHPLGARAIANRHRAKKHGTSGDHTADDLAAILARQDHRCAYCGADLRMVEKNADHRMPMAQGGSNGPDNLQYLCGTCNRAKASKHPDDYEASIGLTPTRFP